MNTTEIKVMNFYRNIEIVKPYQLSVSSISERLNITVATHLLQKRYLVAINLHTLTTLEQSYRYLSL